MKRLVLAGIGLILCAPFPIAACSLCGSLLRNQDTLGEEMDRARLVVYGRAVSSALDPNPNARPGQGRTEFQIDRILKDDPALVNKKGLLLEQWVPVLNAKDPPRFVWFGMVQNGRIDKYEMRQVHSEAVLTYLEGSAKLRGKERATALQYYFHFLDHPDTTVAGDALLEFARANDKEVEQVSRLLKPERIRGLIQNPGTKAEAIGLLGFLLGGCGEPRDADFLLGLIKRNEETWRNARDGLFAGYISLKPREGWELLRTHLADKKKPIIPDRWSAICALRFCYNLKPKEHRQGALSCLEAMLADGAAADMAVDDLRKWQLWDLTNTVLAQYGKQSHAAPIARQAIIRYALSCPRPEARQFLDRIRPRDGAEIDYLAGRLRDEKLE